MIPICFKTAEWLHLYREPENRRKYDLLLPFHSLLEILVTSFLGNHSGSILPEKKCLVTFYFNITIPVLSFSNTRCISCHFAKLESRKTY